MNRTNEQLAVITHNVRVKACAALKGQDQTHWTRNDYQELFRAEAIKLGVENKTPDMGSIVTRCLAAYGFGT